MHDLKQCINNIDRPSKANEFPNQHSYDAWQKREMKQLTELLKTLTLLDPTLSTAGDDMDARSHKVQRDLKTLFLLRNSAHSFLFDMTGGLHVYSRGSSRCLPSPDDTVS